MPEKKKFYITTSLVYTNASVHIGFALEVIQADVIARYHRLQGDDVFFLTGTDEHGAKIARSAEKEGKTPEEFTEELTQRVKALKKVLNLSNDDFIRTTDQKRHWPGVKKVWLKLKENGDIYKKKYKGFYCIGCEAFVTEKDLVDGKCPIHKKLPEIIEEENYFFRLSQYAKQIERTIEKDKIKIIPETRKNEILSFIKKKVEDISCSRLREKVRWGIPVPDDNTQSVYVWMEALVNYISALGYAQDGEKFKKFWPANVHCIGKDIFRFHILLWPAIILSLGLELPKTIFVHGFLTVNGQKMSKSLGNVIDPFDLVQKYGTDAVRYFLLREILPTEDGDFTYEKFEGRYNSDLAKGLGNLTSRILTMAGKVNLKSKIQMSNQIQNPNVKKETNKTWENYKTSLDEFKFNEALIAIWGLISYCDRYIERQKPWELLSQAQSSKLKTQKLEGILFNLLTCLKEIAQMLQPFLPGTSKKILQQLKSGKKETLFPKIETLTKD